jgi:MtN3 and saliva related transmembrane protein
MQGADTEKSRYGNGRTDSRFSQAMPVATTEMLGFAAAALTTLCWLPQAWHTIRTRDTRAISLWTQVFFALGIVLWLVYGVLLMSWPLIGANSVTLLLVLVILSMKLRYG